MNFRLFPGIGFLLFGLIVVNGCSSSSPSESGTNSSTATVFGEVMDENGFPVAGAVVTSGSQTTTTDQNGYFELGNATVQTNRALVTGAKTGYISTSKTPPVSNGFAQTQITLMTDAVYEVSASSGTTAELSDGGTVRLPANGILQNGQVYSGTVEIHARHIDPSSDGFFNRFPGDFSATQTDGSSTTLYSYGVLGVTLTDPSGTPLTLAAGDSAILSWPIAADQLASAPATIPLWYYNESSGLWIEEGFAQSDGAEYIGKVGHFSWHNADNGNHPALIFGRVLCDSTPLAGVPVQVGQTIVYTDARGVFKTNVPSGLGDITVTVAPNGMNLQSNTDVVHAPASNQDYGADLQVTDCTTITGTLVACNGQAETGIIRASWTGGFASFPVSGTFTLHAPSFLPILLTLPSGGTQSVASLSPGETRNIGTIKDCATSSSGNTGSFTADGTTIAFDSIDFGNSGYNGGDTLGVFFYRHGNYLSELYWAYPAVGTYPMGGVNGSDANASYVDTVNYPGSFFVTYTPDGWTGTLKITRCDATEVDGNFDCQAGDFNGATTHVYHLTASFKCRR